ncbi:PD40 domain-containing protein [Flagellimonas pacifica]|uniref:WD40-like Beta Propeller Repeat n=1 Tax=Flagellimonas pacifica TaxID=1247520 RepID=A0A285MRV8_9FLAO|nr:PD40 domain-containing protein [Allomuricauda parva]SNY99922.1 WD40-like Beta Propeller Repeat [Allomuricauda parva]
MRNQKRNTYQTLLLVTYCFIVNSYGQQGDKNNPFTKYEDANSPVQLFPGEISVDALQWNNTFTQNNQKIYYCQQLPTRSRLVVQEFDGMRFSKPEPIPFDTIYNYSDPYVNAKGDHLIFMSNLPYKVNKDSLTTNFQLWQSYKLAKGWSKPETVFLNKNGIGYPWRTQDGTLFYAMQPSDGTRNSNIYYAPYKNGEYGKPVALPANINSDKFEGDAFVAPNKEYLIFAGFNRDDNIGFSDLYIAFNLGKNKWSNPRSLGREINSDGYDGSPYVTEDGKFLIFTSSRNSKEDNIFFNHYIVRFNKDNYRG